MSMSPNSKAGDETVGGSPASRRGRLVMLSILALILVIPAVNLTQIMRRGVPAGLQQGDMQTAYVIGMFFSVILVLAWYYAWRGRRRARLVLGWVYLLAALMIGVMALALGIVGFALPPGWPLGMIFVAIYGCGGWVLLASPAIRDFQKAQRAFYAGSHG
jgi:hypothetical protein